MLNEETIKILMEISSECISHIRKNGRCEGCQYYLPNMPDEEDCLFFNGPGIWGDYLKIIVDRAKQEESKDGWCNTCKHKHHKSKCIYCAKYDEHDNLIALSNYESEEK